jgi:two-component system KDP operon response regulator KdpE
MAKLDTVLVVDDEPPIRRLLRTSLAASGCRIIEAEDAAGAMRVLATEQADLIILDLGLPDKSGLELISEIRKTSAVPIVALSARHDERSKVEALDLGADDYVSKPFGMAELLARSTMLCRSLKGLASAGSRLSFAGIKASRCYGRGITRPPRNCLAKP